MQVLILSPHRDDAAFSCGLLLAGLLEAAHALTIVNVCTVSSYAPYLAHGAENRELQVSKARLKEDITFIELLINQTNRTPECVLMRDLEWQDLPLRWGTEDGASLKDSALRTDEVAAMQEVFKALPPADLFLCPKAIGGHLDHRLVCRAAQRAFPLSSLVFYEDLPYACGSLTKPSLELGDLQGLQELWLCSKNETGGRKREFCLKYSSQIDRAAAELMEQYGQRHGGECFTALPETLRVLRNALDATGAIA